MVIRTRNCEFCEYKIYPGRGIVYVARDGSSKLYINYKSMTLDKAKTKSHMIRWTTAWRRKNKKLKTAGIVKRRRRKRTKRLKNISGMTVEQVRERRKANTGDNADKRRREIRDNKRKNKNNKRNQGGANRNQKTANRNVRGGGNRGR